MLGARQAIIEAIWYLRGEKSIEFLQHFDCRFWDQQADERAKLWFACQLST